MTTFDEPDKIAVVSVGSFAISFIATTCVFVSCCLCFFIFNSQQRHLIFREFQIVERIESFTCCALCSFKHVFEKFVGVFCCSKKCRKPDCAKKCLLKLVKYFILGLKRYAVFFPSLLLFVVLFCIPFLIAAETFYFIMFPMFAKTDDYYFYNIGLIIGSTVTLVLPLLSSLVDSRVFKRLNYYIVAVFLRCGRLNKRDIRERTNANLCWKIIYQILNPLYFESTTNRPLCSFCFLARMFFFLFYSFIFLFFGLFFLGIPLFVTERFKKPKDEGTDHSSIDPVVVQGFLYLGIGLGVIGSVVMKFFRSHERSFTNSELKDEMRSVIYDFNGSAFTVERLRIILNSVNDQKVGRKRVLRMGIEMMLFSNADFDCGIYAWKVDHKLLGFHHTWNFRGVNMKSMRRFIMWMLHNERTEHRVFYHVEEDDDDVDGSQQKLELQFGVENLAMEDCIKGVFVESKDEENKRIEVIVVFENCLFVGSKKELRKLSLYTRDDDDDDDDDDTNIMYFYEGKKRIMKTKEEQIEHLKRFNVADEIFELMNSDKHKDWNDIEQKRQTKFKMDLEGDDLESDSSQEEQNVEETEETGIQDTNSVTIEISDNSRRDEEEKKIVMKKKKKKKKKMVKQSRFPVKKRSKKVEAFRRRKEDKPKKEEEPKTIEEEEEGEEPDISTPLIDPTESETKTYDGSIGTREDGDDGQVVVGEEVLVEEASRVKKKKKKIAVYSQQHRIKMEIRVDHLIDYYREYLGEDCLLVDVKFGNMVYRTDYSTPVEKDDSDDDSDDDVLDFDEIIKVDAVPCKGSVTEPPVFQSGDDTKLKPDQLRNQRKFLKPVSRIRKKKKRKKIYPDEDFFDNVSGIHNESYNYFPNQKNFKKSVNVQRFIVLDE